MWASWHSRSAGSGIPVISRMKISSHQYGIAYRHRNCGNTTIYIRSESFHLDQITTNVPDLPTVNMLLPSACRGLCPGRKCNNSTSRTQENESLCWGEVCHRRCKYTTFFENECKNSGKVLPLTILQASGGDRHLGEPVPEIFLFANVAAVWAEFGLHSAMCESPRYNAAKI